MFHFHPNLRLLPGGRGRGRGEGGGGRWGLLYVESASVRFPHRVQERPAREAPEKTGCREQKGVEGGGLLRACSSRNPKGQEMTSPRNPLPR